MDSVVKVTGWRRTWCRSHRQLGIPSMSHLRDFGAHFLGDDQNALLLSWGPECTVMAQDTRPMSQISSNSHFNCLESLSETS